MIIADTAAMTKLRNPSAVAEEAPLSPSTLSPAGAGVGALVDVAPPPPPELLGSRTRSPTPKTSSVTIAMLPLLMPNTHSAAELDGSNEPDDMAGSPGALYESTLCHATVPSDVPIYNGRSKSER